MLIARIAQIAQIAQTKRAIDVIELSMTTDNTIVVYVLHHRYHTAELAKNITIVPTSVFTYINKYTVTRLHGSAFFSYIFH